jgi:type I restriction enzyme S subunit
MNGVMGKIVVPFPAVPEQQKIADCLSSLDDIITAEDKKLESLKAHKKGLMQKLFPAQGATVPEWRFPEFRDAGEWEEKPISSLCRVTQGGTPSTSVPEFWGGNIQWVTPAEMGKRYNKYITDTVRTLTDEGLSNCSSELLPVDSVIVSTRAPIGLLAINKKPMAINQGCHGLIPLPGYNTDFIFFRLEITKSKLNDIGAGNTFKELSGSSLKAFPITVPELPEQQKIADCLSSLDDFIAAENEQLEALKAYKKGLMQGLFPSIEEVAE